MFIKIGTNFSIETKFAQIYNFGSKPSVPIHNQHNRFTQTEKFYENWSTFHFSEQISEISNFRSRSSLVHS